jgi:dephospho-CoA kinase
MSLIVGLTGGIATGKSTITGFFKEANIPVIETDSIAKSVMVKGSDVYHSVLETFGDQVLLSNQEINRKALGQLIFTDEAAREKLNAIVHPAVKSIMLKEIETCELEGKKLIVVDVPLLFEAGFDAHVDVSLVVCTEEEIQLKRLMARDGIEKGYALKKIKAQMPLTLKREKADYVLDNSASILSTKKAFSDILEALKERAGWVS